jgi:hypothetical protein
LQMFMKANWTELTSSYKTPFFKSLGHWFSGENYLKGQSQEKVGEIGYGALVQGQSLTQNSY